MKKSWLVTVPGTPPFPMIHYEDLTPSDALALVRGIWPQATAE